MATKPLLTLAIALLVTSSAASSGEMNASADELPAFTAAEDRIIARNEILALVVRDDPWLARRALDALAALEAGPQALQRSMSGLAAPPADDPAGKAVEGDDFDPADNPDLRRLERAAPEALHDLFQVLKQAGSGKPKEVK